MSRRDISVFSSNHNSEALSFPVGAGTSKNVIDTSWREGEVGIITAASGDIDVIASGTADPSTGLIHLFGDSSEGLIVKAGGLAATTGAADAKGCRVIPFESGTKFVTRNVFNNANTNIGPAGSGAMTGCTIGADCDLWRQTVANGGTVGGGVNGDFGIDLNGDWFTITDILNAQGQPTSQFGGTPNWVVFERLGL